MRRSVLAKIVLLASAVSAACANPVETPPMARDAGPAPAKDGGVVAPATVVIERSNLAPAAQAGEAGAYRIRGHLRSTDVRTATTTSHRIRGGVVPLGR
jgi:hypothetical protein